MERLYFNASADQAHRHMPDLGFGMAMLHIVPDRVKRGNVVVGCCYAKAHARFFMQQECLCHFTGIRFFSTYNAREDGMGKRITY